MPNTPVYGIPYDVLTDTPDGAALGAGIALGVETELVRIDADVAAVEARATILEAGQNVNGFFLFSPGESTGATTYANLGAGSSCSFTKRYAATRLLVSMTADFVTSATGRGVEFAVQIGATDYLVAPAHQALPASAVRLHTSGQIIISGIAASTFTVQGRWKCAGGAGTISRIVNDDYISCIISEIH